MELFNFGRVPSDLLIPEKADLSTYNPLREMAVGIYNAGRRTKATCGANAAAIRIVRVDGPDALMFLTAVFSNCAQIGGVHSKAAQRLVNFLVTEGSTKRNARGTTGAAREFKSAERVMDEYLAWKQGDTKNNASPGVRRKPGELPKHFTISDVKMESVRQVIREEGIRAAIAGTGPKTAK